MSVYILQGCLDGKKQDKNGNEQAKKGKKKAKVHKKAKRTKRRAKSADFATSGKKRFCMEAQKQKLTQNKKDFTPNELTRKSFCEVQKNSLI